MPDKKFPGALQISGSLKRRTGKSHIPKVDLPKTPQPEPTDPPMLIQGMEADSKEEYWTSIALERLGWGYDYQHQIGLPGTVGSQRLDFLIYTHGRRTIGDVRGRFWHTGKYEDALSVEQIAAKYQWRLVVAWDDKDLTSPEIAYLFWKKQLGSNK